MMANDQQTLYAGPGKTLRQARVDLKLSIEEVALQLHLAPRQIDALESDDYENLPQPTYVRGYLRNYAHLLGLALEPLMDAYNRSQPNRAVAPAPIPTATNETSSGDGHIKLISFIVGAVVLGFAIAWWQGRQPAPAPENTPGTSVQTEPPAAVQNAAPPVADNAAPAAQERVKVPDAAREAKSEPPKAPMSALTKREPAKSVETKPEPVKTAPVATVKPRRVGVPIDTPSPSSALPSGNARVVLRATQDSWAEVRDAQGKRLLYETVPAGRMVSVEGTAPLSVFLGNVDGVKIEANGQPFNPARYRRGVIARFPVPAPTPSVTRVPATTSSSPTSHASVAAPAPPAVASPRAAAPAPAEPAPPAAPAAPQAPSAPGSSSATP